MVGHPGPRPSARRRGHAGLPYPQARRRAGRSDRRLGPGEVDGRSAPPSRRRADAARRVHGAARGEPRAGPAAVARPARCRRAPSRVRPHPRAADARALGRARPESPRPDPRDPARVTGPAPSLVALVLVLLASRVAAASTHDAAEAGFVKRVVDAINTPETARAAALLHPTSLVCPSEYEAAMSFFDPRLGAKGPVPPTFTWRMEEAPAGPPMFSDRVGYPVRPSHLLHITYEARPNASTTLIVQTVR